MTHGLFGEQQFPPALLDDRPAAAATMPRLISSAVNALTVAAMNDGVDLDWTTLRVLVLPSRFGGHAAVQALAETLPPGPQ